MEWGDWEQRAHKLLETRWHWIVQAVRVGLKSSLMSWHLSYLKMSIPRNTGPDGVPVVLLTDRAPLPSGARWVSTGVKLKLGCVFRREECATLRINQDFSRNGADILPLLSHVYSSPHRTNQTAPRDEFSYMGTESAASQNHKQPLCGLTQPSWLVSKHLPWPLPPHVYFTGSRINPIIR